MNKRILELSNIAYMNHMERNPHSSFGRRYDYDKEFAELIVRECAEVAADHDALDIYEEIRQHFGVEE